MTAPPRDRPRRRRDVLDRLERDVDAWVASADPATGTPWLIPLSFLWDGTTLLIATPAASPTGRNLAASGLVRLGLGEVRDVVIVEGAATVVPPGDLTGPLGDRFAAKTGFDPRAESVPYRYFRVTPRRVQAWREADELAGRELMRDGRWLD